MSRWVAGVKADWQEETGDWKQEGMESHTQTDSHTHRENKQETQVLTSDQVFIMV